MFEDLLPVLALETKHSMCTILFEYELQEQIINHVTPPLQCLLITFSIWTIQGRGWTATTGQSCPRAATSSWPLWTTVKYVSPLPPPTHTPLPFNPQGSLLVNSSVCVCVCCSSEQQAPSASSVHLPDRRVLQRRQERHGQHRQIGRAHV